MKIVCASSVLDGAATFAPLGDVTVLTEEEIGPDDLRDAEILVTRSKAKINQSLLEGSAVRFVGCAVAGTDHIDENWLNQTDIAWYNAAGCNANSVAEYIITALLHEAETHQFECAQCTLGIIGVGHIGSRVAAKAEALGMTVLLNDPPRALAEGRDHWDFIDLEDLLPAADIVTCHVPYTADGPFATEHLINHRFVSQLTPGCLLINAARGEIMASDAVHQGLSQGVLRQAVLDVWENEPRIAKDLLDRVDIGTPHIAGYSYEGRLNGTQMVFEACCRFLEIEPPPLEVAADPAVQPAAQTLDGRGLTDQQILQRLTQQAYPLLEDDQRFRAGASADPKEMGQHFVHCRRTYPVRREFAAHRIDLVNVPASARSVASALDFAVCD